MNTELARALRLPPVQERLTQMGIDMAFDPRPTNRALRHSAKSPRWSKVVKDNNIRAGR